MFLYSHLNTPVDQCEGLWYLQYFLTESVKRAELLLFYYFILLVCVSWVQMLQAVSNVAPRGVYVCGNATSTSGLTVTNFLVFCLHNFPSTFSWQNWIMKKTFVFVIERFISWFRRSKRRKSNGREGQFEVNTFHTLFATLFFRLHCLRKAPLEIILWRLEHLC